MEKDDRRAGTALGWAVYGSIAVGVLSVLASALFLSDGQAAALCLIAAALAFGLLANALLRQ